MVPSWAQQCIAESALTAGAAPGPCGSRRSSFPMRYALIGREICMRIRKRPGHHQVVAEAREALQEMQRQCQASLLGCLDNVSSPNAARKILLSSRGTLGSRSRLPVNLLELGIELRNKDFIGHPWCQKLLDECWQGRDAAAGKVMIAQQPHFVLLVLQALVGWTGLQLVELKVNPEHGVSESLSRDSAIGLRDEAPERGGLVEISVLEQVLHVYKIPCVKHALSLVSMAVRSVVFIVFAVWNPYTLAALYRRTNAELQLRNSTQMQELYTREIYPRLQWEPAELDQLSQFDLGGIDFTFFAFVLSDVLYVCTEILRLGLGYWTQGAKLLEFALGVAFLCGCTCRYLLVSRYAHVHAQMHARVHASTNACTYTCTDTWTYTCTDACTYT